METHFWTIANNNDSNKEYLFLMIKPSAERWNTVYAYVP